MSDSIKNLICPKCGYAGSVTRWQDKIGASCTSCNYLVPCELDTAEMLFVAWNDYVPIRIASADIGTAIGNMIKYINEKGGPINSKELLPLGQDSKISRRALAILSDTGLIKVRYFVDFGGHEKEVGPYEAKSKRDGGFKIRVECEANYVLK